MKSESLKTKKSDVNLCQPLFDQEGSKQKQNRQLTPFHFLLLFPPRPLLCIFSPVRSSVRLMDNPALVLGGSIHRQKNLINSVPF